MSLVCSWIILGVLFIQALAEDGISYTSENGPAFYENDLVNFTCKFTIDKVRRDQLSGFGLRLNKTEGGFGMALGDGCAISRSPGVTTVNSNKKDLIEDEQCETAFAAMKDGQATLAIRNVELTETGDYMCATWTSAAYNNQESRVSVRSLIVAPTKLSMTFSNKVYSGDTVSISCESESGEPAAVFEYGKDSENLGNEIGDFEATRELNGASYWCRDTSHPNLQGGDNPLTYRKKSLVVYYFVGTKTGVTSMKLNPAESKEITCPVNKNLPADVSVSYSWTKNLTEIRGETNDFLKISQDESNDTVSETYECTAKLSNDKLPEVKVKYIVLWDVGTVVTTTMPTTTKIVPTKDPEENDKTPKIAKLEKTGGTTMTIVIVVVVLTVIAVIIIIVVIVIRKRKNNSADLPKDAGSPPKKCDPEQGTVENEASEPMLKESEGGDKTADEPGKQ